MVTICNNDGSSGCSCCLDLWSEWSGDHVGALTLLTFKHARGVDQNNSMEPSLAHISTYIITIAISSQYPGCPLKNQRGFHRSPNSRIPPETNDSARNPARPAVAPRSGKRVCSSTGRASIVESLGGCCKGCWSMCNSRCPEMQTCKGQEFVSFQGNDHFKRKVCWYALFSIHFTKKIFQESANVPLQKGNLYLSIPCPPFYDVYQNPQRIPLLSGCSYSYMSMPFLLIPIPSQRKKCLWEGAGPVFG